MKIYSIGDEGYLPDGRKVAVTGVAGQGYFVSELYEDGEGYPLAESEHNSFYVRQIYASVPEPQKDDRIIKLEQQLQEKRAELRNLEQDIAQKEKDVQEILKAHEPLSYIKAILGGELKYAVIWSDHSVKMGLVPEILKSTSGDVDKGMLRLVSMFGRLGTSTLEWRVSQWSDGSDKWYRDQVAFYATEQDALLQVEKLAQKRFTRFKEQRSDNCNIEDLISYGVKIPQNILDANRAHAEKSLKSSLASAERDVVRARENYAKHQKIYEEILARQTSGA